MNEYDVRKAFEEMELELIASMKRNLQRHLDWEKDEGFNWNMWQVEQLKTLENFKKENQKIFNKKFSSINAEIANFLKNSYETAGFETETGILDELAKGMFVNSNSQKGINNSFFSLNKSKMEALIKATTKDMEKAEHAMLRMVNDQYRKTIFNAQIMANSGAFTLQQSIDKATKDFLRIGINCIQYKNGRRVNIATYAEMAIRTANKRAVLISEGDTRNAYGIHTVRISRYGGCSETCLPWQGRIYVDDVYSGGTKEEAQEKKLPLLSNAIAGGLFHPNCKHRATTYFYDLKKSLGKIQEDGVENPPKEQQHRKNLLHIQQQKRIEQGSLDRNNIQQSKAKKEIWQDNDNKLSMFFSETDKDATITRNIIKEELPDIFNYSERKTKNLYDSYFKIDSSYLETGYEYLSINHYDSGKSTELGIISSHSSSKVGLDENVISYIEQQDDNSLVSIHNHPSKSTFSIGDVLTHYNTPQFKESIVINSDGGIYHLHVGKRDGILKEKEFVEYVRNIRRQISKKYTGLNKNEVNHLTWKQIAKTLGWDYGYEKITTE